MRTRNSRSSRRRRGLSLLLRVITVSLETMKIVAALPALDLMD